MQKPLTAIIIDDEPDARNELQRVIAENLENITIVGKARDAQTGLELIIDYNPDIVFLDIQMPGKDGFWLADKINKLNNSTDVIFVTAYDEYAIEAIKHAAFDFLTKPVIPNLLKETITRYFDKSKKDDLKNKFDSLNSYLQKDKIKFPNLDGFIMIKPEDIVYCEADGNYTKLHLTNGKNELVTSLLGAIENNLPEKSFVRISRFTLVNLDYLVSYNRKIKTVSLSDTLQEYELSVSSSGAKRLSLL